MTREGLLELLRQGARVRYVPRSVSGGWGAPEVRDLYIDSRRPWRGEEREISLLLEELVREGAVQCQRDDIGCTHYRLVEG